MPSPGEDIQSWSTTAANNGNADPLINWVEHQTRASVNNSARGMLAAHAKNRDLFNGSISTTGSANVQAFLSGVSYTTLPPGLRATLKIGAGLTNTGAVTLNCDGTGPITVKTATGLDLVGGELAAGSYVDLLYNGTNWILPGAVLNSPILAGDPRATTPPDNDNDTSIATTEWVNDRLTGGGGIIIGQQLFTASGTYTPTNGMESCIIECMGGGGGGGGCTGGIGYNLLGSGGGGGSYSRTISDAAAIGASQAVTIGAGGAAGSPGLVAPSGGNTSVGTLCIANGGLGGNFGYINQTPAGGQGGAAGTGSLAVPGPSGQGGFNTTNTSGYAILGSGAHTIWGRGGTAGSMSGGSANAGNAGTGFGAGGGGAAASDVSASASGGAGMPGLVFITEFSGRGAPGLDGADGTDGATGPIGPPGPAGAGTGDVLVSGTPTAGQWARWINANSIEGVAAPTVTIAAPQRTVLTSGSGTYTTPAGATWLEVEMVGGGGGGGAGASGGTLGTAGGNTTLGTLTANGGGAGAYNVRGTGGTASGGDVNLSGGDGSLSGSVGDASPSFSSGSDGGNGAFGGAGTGANAAVGTAAKANTGAGGGGGGTNSPGPSSAGGGGGAGGYVRKLFAPPSATYAYTVGAAGNGGAAVGGGVAGGNGAAGIIIVTAHFGG